MFWLFVGIILFGGVIEYMRNIALSTTVTLLVTNRQLDTRTLGQITAEVYKMAGFADMVTPTVASMPTWSNPTSP